MIKKHYRSQFLPSNVCKYLVHAVVCPCDGKCIFLKLEYLANHLAILFAVQPSSSNTNPTATPWDNTNYFRSEDYNNHYFNL